MDGFEPPAPKKSTYTEEKATIVCDAIACGNTMTKAAELAGITTNDIYRWAYKQKEFSDALILARTHQAHAIMDKAFESMEEYASQGMAKEGRQAVEGYIKIAEKMNPRKYGMKHVEHSGEVKKTLSADERNLRILELLAKANPELFQQNVKEIGITAEPFGLLEDSKAGRGEEITVENDGGFFNDTKA